MGYWRRQDNDAWIDELLIEQAWPTRFTPTCASLSGGMKRRVLVAQPW